MGPNGNNSKQQQQQSKCSPARVKSCLRTFLAHLFSHIGLCILVVGYAIVGAAIFERLESGFEKEQRENKQKNWTSTFQKIRKQYVNELWNITEQFNVLYEKNWTSAVEQELRRFEEIVAESAGQHGYVVNTRESDPHWSFSGALLYSVSIITTIGYGNTAPRTASGKVLTMFYAVIGVPLMLLWLSNIGTLMANTFKFAYNHICCPRKSPRSRSVQKRSPSLKQEPSSIQVKYSVSAMTCETHVVQQQQHQHPQQFQQQQYRHHPHHQQQQLLHHPPPPPHHNIPPNSDSSNFHNNSDKYPRATSATLRREQKASLKALDPAAKQMLRECAEYNVSMSQDERSRMVLQQLQAAENNGNGGGCGGSVVVGTMAGIEEEICEEDDAMLGGHAIILPPPLNIDGIEMMEDSYDCRQVGLIPPNMIVNSGGCGGSSGGSVSGSMLRTVVRGEGGGYESESASQMNPMMNQMEGTPSRVPLLHRGVETGPDVVDVETLDDYTGGSIEMPSSSLDNPKDLSNIENPVASSPGADTSFMEFSGDRVPISLVLIFVVFYIMVGAMVFSVWEEWSFLESAYFCFITLSTIGLGDYVPGRSLKSAGSEEGHAQLIVCCLYLVLGLAIIAMSFNLVQEEVAAKVKDIARHIGIIKSGPGDR